MKKRIAIIIAATLLLLAAIVGILFYWKQFAGLNGRDDQLYGDENDVKDQDADLSFTETYVRKGQNPVPTYMVHYGGINLSVMQIAKLYDVVILHPTDGHISRQQVAELQASGTTVLGYISIGEDLRTKHISPELMKDDPRFQGDGSGPRIDPRKAGEKGIDGLDIMGIPSDGGTGYASYYLDDNDHNGMPDMNPNFGCAYTNIGDPAWYDVLENMTIENDGAAGLKEILTTDYGRGLGCDGAFLDTIDTVAPNSFTQDTDDFRTRFEWTASGVKEFCKKYKENHPGKYLLQNRGLFFYNPRFPHYASNPGEYIDYLLYESFRLDSNTGILYNENFFIDNLNEYGPKVATEAGRENGFQVFSLGYAEGPAEYDMHNTLMGLGFAGRQELVEDIRYAQEEMGFSHYITNGSINIANTFVLEHQRLEDTTPPKWSSCYNPSDTFPIEPVIPRYGIGEVEYSKEGLLVRWDLALDRSGVDYYLFYQEEAFDYENDPKMESAQSVKLVPEMVEDYGYMKQKDAYPYQQLITDLKLKQNRGYYFAIKAVDRSVNRNMDDNTIYRYIITQSGVIEEPEEAE